MNSKSISTGVLLAFLTSSAFGYDGLDLYDARISPKDRVNSQGTPLKTVAAILAQDRANYHRFKKRDPQDASDLTFDTQTGRALFQSARIEITPKLKKEILSGKEVDITVYVYTEDRMEVRAGLLKFIP